MLSRASVLTSQRGLSMIEMVVVLGIIAVGSAIAIPVTMSMVRNARGDSAVAATEAFLETVRNRAVAERRNMQLTINSNNIVVQRIEVPSGTLTNVDQFTLEQGEQFDKLSGSLPVTPDGMASAGTADFRWYCGAPPVMFTSDGSMVDSAGDVCNGIIYVARPGQLETQRAVTILGVTGLLRSWKWRGTVWQQ
jgi:prepilin-type N-terminal cleavage/methylation domain-containing protein